MRPSKRSHAEATAESAHKPSYGESPLWHPTRITYRGSISLLMNRFTRRRFLGTCTAASGLALLAPYQLFASRDGPAIQHIDVFPVVYPMVGRFKFFEDPAGTLTGRASAIVRITAEDGTVGWGESIPIPKWSYETLETVTTTLRNYLAPQLIGHNVFDIAGAHRVMDQNIAPSFATGQPMAKAGIDIALHDLAGKISGLSLPQMWGRMPRETITLSWTLNPKTLDELDTLIDEGRARGYRHFNIKVGAGEAYDLALSRRTRARVPDGFLWADANGAMNRLQALALAPKLAEAGVDVLEQPLPSNSLTGYRELKAQAALPILMDEGVVSPSSLMEFIRLDLLDGVAMKVPRSGGIMPAKRQIEMLEDARLMFLGSGLTDPGISLAATLQLYGAFGYERPAALNGPQFMDTSVLVRPLEPEAGTLTVPSGPGLGIDVDEGKVRDLMVDL